MEMEDRRTISSIKGKDIWHKNPLSTQVVKETPFSELVFGDGQEHVDTGNLGLSGKEVSDIPETLETKIICLLNLIGALEDRGKKLG